MDLRRKHILIVCSQRYDYYKIIMEELNRRGAYVKVMPTPHLSYMKKLQIEYKIGSYSTIIPEYWQHSMAELDSGYDAILILTPFLIPIKVFSALRSRYTNTPIIAYHWDDIKVFYCPVDEHRKYCDRILSYNMDESNTYGFIYRPFFYSDRIVLTNVTGRGNQGLRPILCGSSRHKTA